MDKARGLPRKAKTPAPFFARRHEASCIHPKLKDVLSCTRTTGEVAKVVASKTEGSVRH